MIYLSLYLWRGLDVLVRQTECCYSAFYVAIYYLCSFVFMFMLMFCIILIIVSLVMRTSCCTCAPSFVGVASPVSEIVLIFPCLQNGQNFPLDHGL